MADLMTNGVKQFTVAVCLLLTGVIAQAQKAKPAASAEAELELKERRAKARSLLVALSSDARTFHDETLRARSLARIGLNRCADI